MAEVDRRSFLTGLGAALFAAPAIVRASSLMPVSLPLDDAAYLQGLIDRTPLGGALRVPEGIYKLARPLVLRRSILLCGQGSMIEAPPENPAIYLKADSVCLRDVKIVVPPGPNGALRAAAALVQP